MTTIMMICRTLLLLYLTAATAEQSQSESCTLSRRNKCDICARRSHTMTTPAAIVDRQVIEERGYAEAFRPLLAGSSNAITCCELDNFLQEAGEDSGFCMAGKDFRDVCNCFDGETNTANTVINNNGANSGNSTTISTTNTTNNGGNKSAGKSKGRRYMDADTQSQKAWLAWTPRISAFFSLVGSALILKDIWWQRPQRRRLQRQRSGSSRHFTNAANKTVYHWLMTAISIFDMFGSAAWFASTWPIPKEQDSIYGAAGNDATCKAQGFFMQLGITGPFLFVALSIYYVLTIRYNVRESRIDQWKYYFLGPPIIAGIALAFVALPKYKPIYLLCHLQPMKLIGTRDPHDSIIPYVVMLPIVLALLTAMVAMYITYWHVRKTDRAAHRWRFNTHAAPRSSTTTTTNSSNLMANGSSRHSTTSTRTRSSASSSSPSLTNAVFWQFALYVAAFFLTWPIYFFAVLDAIQPGFVFWIFLVILQPLQGFWNALAYYRPTLAQAYQQWNRKRQLRKSAAVASADVAKGQEDIKVTALKEDKVETDRPVAKEDPSAVVDPTEDPTEDLPEDPTEDATGTDPLPSSVLVTETPSTAAPLTSFRASAMNIVDMSRDLGDLHISDDDDDGDDDAVEDEESPRVGQE